MRPLILLVITPRSAPHIWLLTGVGRITQFIFAFAIPKSMPGAILSNMAVASLTEAGGWQSAGLMGELKMGFLTGVSEKDMLHAQIICSTFGGITGGLIYRLYTKVYEMPSDSFPAPHTHMVYSSAVIMYGDRLPTGVTPFALCAMMLSALATLLRIFRNPRWIGYVPQSLAIAIGTSISNISRPFYSLTKTGMYIRPEFTLTRSVGGLIR